MALEQYKSILRKVDPKLARFSDELTATISDIYAKIGSRPPRKIDAVTGQSPAIPPTPTMTVAGVTGVGFQIDLVDPQDVQPISVNLAKAKILNAANAPLTPIRYNLQSATSLNFDASAGLKDHGSYAQYKWTILAKNVTWYWRARASFDGQNWGPWRVYSGAGGPISVSV